MDKDKGDLINMKPMGPLGCPIPLPKECCTCSLFPLC